MSALHELTTSQLRQALQIREQIEGLQQRLDGLLNGAAPAPAKAKGARGRPKGARTMSDEARARIGAAAKARWAKLRGGKAAPAKTSATAEPKKKGGLTAAGRAKLAASMKARWAARKKGGAAPNSPAA